MPTIADHYKKYGRILIDKFSDNNVIFSEILKIVPSVYNVFIIIISTQVTHRGKCVQATKLLSLKVCTIHVVGLYCK